MASQVEIWQKWERENGEKYKGKPVLIRGREFSVHRYNPNIVAITVIVAEEIKNKRKCLIRCVVTVLHSTNSGEKPYFVTSCYTTRLDPKLHPRSNPEEGRFYALWNEKEKALANHKQMVGNLVNSVKNPAWRVSSVKEHTLGAEWDEKAARDYNHAYGLGTVWRFDELQVGDTFGLDRASNAYVKVSETEAHWKGHEEGKNQTIPADYPCVR